MDLCRCRESYQRLQDDYSRFIYEKRIAYSITGDGKYLNDILQLIIDRDKLADLEKKMNSVKDKLAIRGAGNDYWILKSLCPEIEFLFFVDNDTTKQGRLIDDKMVISPREFYENYRDYYVLVNSAAANKEIIDELRNNGISGDHIINLADCYSSICDKQYFENEIMESEEDEVFVDGGCYDGRTIRQFMGWCNNKYKRIYAFEPDNISFKRISERLKAEGIRDVVLINKGLWSSETELKFNEDGSQGARITEGGTRIIRTATVDDTVNDEKVTFIKLDVEGAEYETLLGARRTIEKNKPKMAISVYHKPEDIFELPELIMSINSDYKFYLRHYQLSPNETILYCV